MSKTGVRLYVKVRGKDEYRRRTDAELRAAAEKKQRAEQRRFYAKFGLRVEKERPGPRSEP